MTEIQFPPDHIEWIKKNLKIPETGIEEMINFVVSRTGLSYGTASVAIREYLLLMRTAVLETGQVYLDNLGRIKLGAPKFGKIRHKFHIKNKKMIRDELD